MTQITLEKPVVDFLAVLDAFARAKKLSESRASTYALGGGHRAASIRAGGEIGVNRMGEALRYMSDNWPEDSEIGWPDGIARPARSKKAKGK